MAEPIVGLLSRDLKDGTIHLPEALSLFITDPPHIDQLHPLSDLVCLSQHSVHR
jgi:hypothetical protein